MNFLISSILANCFVMTKNLKVFYVKRLLSVLSTCPMKIT